MSSICMWRFQNSTPSLNRKHKDSLRRKTNHKHCFIEDCYRFFFSFYRFFRPQLTSEILGNVLINQKARGYYTIPCTYIIIHVCCDVLINVQYGELDTPNPSPFEFSKPSLLPPKSIENFTSSALVLLNRNQLKVAGASWGWRFVINLDLSIRNSYAVGFFFRYDVISHEISHQTKMKQGHCQAAEG